MNSPRPIPKLPTKALATPPHTGDVPTAVRLDGNILPRCWRNDTCFLPTIVGCSRNNSPASYRPLLHHSHTLQCRPRRILGTQVISPIVDYHRTPWIFLCTPHFFHHLSIHTERRAWHLLPSNRKSMAMMNTTTLSA